MTRGQITPGMTIYTITEDSCTEIHLPGIIQPREATTAVRSTGSTRRRLQSIVCGIILMLAGAGITAMFLFSLPIE